MKIEVEIFDDGLEPVTCARNIPKLQFCQFLLSKRFGTVWYCKLFNSWDDELGFCDADPAEYTRASKNIGW